MPRSKLVKKMFSPSFIKTTFSKKTGLYKEKIKGVKHYSIYDRGKRYETIKVSKISSDQAEYMTKKYKTFRKGYEREINHLKNTTESYIVKKAEIKGQEFQTKLFDAPTRKKIFTTKGGEKVKLFQYVVQWRDEKGNIIAGRSQMYNRGLAKTPTQMQQEARNNFLAVLSARWDYQNYDTSEGGNNVRGREIIESEFTNAQRNRIQEGWVSYG